MESYWVGTKSSPEYLIEVNHKAKTMQVYQPDKYSKGLDFYEKYTLGKLIFTSTFDTLQFSNKPIVYKTLKYSPQILLITKKKSILFGKIVQQYISI